MSIINKHKIAILLATYNSSKYLTQQIQSIITQSYTNWTLYIRDDGSDDTTISIIEKYTQLFKNIIFLTDVVKHRGVKDNFGWLMEQVESEYYMFCDHDDVWLPQKIELSMMKMAEYQNVRQDKAIIVHTDLTVVNERLEVIYPSFWKFRHITPQSTSFRYHCACNNVTGCTMLFNKLARDLSLPIPVEASLHDSWIALVVAFHKGIITYIEEPLILYRQHATNIIGTRKIPLIRYHLYNIKEVISNNRRRYKAICCLKKVSLLFFICNKLYYYICTHIIILGAKR
jgi:glycosyltransferase involved in cell wall biosynthesis